MSAPARSAGDGADPGLAGVVPFTFGCHRCGHCCSHGSGHVWLAAGEVERLAARLGATPEAFRARYVTHVLRPETGALEESLRERPDGRCPLLEGANECSVYTDRPAHCASFPYWPSVLADPAGFQRAAEVCPGIRVEPTPEVRAAAFARLAAVYAELDALLAAVRPVCIGRGVCCRFEDAGHELYATALEADYAAAQHPSAPPPEAPGRCPYHVSGRCTARAGRPLGCRTYYCDQPFEGALQATHERLLADIRQIEADLGYPRVYAKFPALLAARGVGPAQSAHPAGKAESHGSSETG
ncbi:MAG: YkgJ family cysteine cluster protein [Planctomycetota bacterium]